MNHNNKKSNSIVILIVLVTLILSFIISKPDKHHFSKSKEKIRTEIDKSNPNSDDSSFLKLAQPGVLLEGLNIGGLNIHQINRLLHKLSQEKSIEPQNAFIFHNKTFDSKFGRSVNIKRTLKNILAAKVRDDISCSYTTIAPTITKKVLNQKDSLYLKRINVKGKLVGHYTTYLANNSVNRRNNIQIALKDINYYQLKKGEEFSFNKIIGLPSLEKGYKKAPIIDSGKFIPKVGGGICQVSTTLYNAILEAKLKVTERHRHSKALSYIQDGRDATIVPQKKDLKFINVTDNPIIILTDIIDRYVAVYIIEEIKD